MTEFNTPSHYVLSDGSDSMDLIAKILGREQFKGFLRGNACQDLGDECDAEVWLDLAKFLSEGLNENE